MPLCRSRVLPLVDDWAATLREQGIGEPFTFGFIDGKAVRIQKPGRGNAAQRYAAQHGVSVNLVQRAFYNGHYGFHGVRTHANLRHYSNRSLVCCSAVLLFFCSASENGSARVGCVQFLFLLR